MHDTFIKIPLIADLPSNNDPVISKLLRIMFI